MRNQVVSRCVTVMSGPSKSLDLFSRSTKIKQEPVACWTFLSVALETVMAPANWNIWRKSCQSRKMKSLRRGSWKYEVWSIPLPANPAAQNGFRFVVSDSFSGWGLDVMGCLGFLPICQDHSPTLTNQLRNSSNNGGRSDQHEERPSSGVWSGWVFDGEFLTTKMTILWRITDDDDPMRRLWLRKAYIWPVGKNPDRDMGKTAGPNTENTEVAMGNSATDLDHVPKPWIFMDVQFKNDGATSKSLAELGFSTTFFSPKGAIVMVLSRSATGRCWPSRKAPLFFSGLTGPCPSWPGIKMGSNVSVSYREVRTINFFGPMDNSKSKPIEKLAENATHILYIFFMSTFGLQNFQLKTNSSFEALVPRSSAMLGPPADSLPTPSFLEASSQAMCREEFEDPKLGQFLEVHRWVASGWSVKLF